MQHLYRPPTWHPRPPARRWLPAGPAAPLAGLDLNSSTHEFGQRTGLGITDFALFASAVINVSVYADADVLLASRLFAYSESTGSNGQLTRKTHAALAAGSWYFLVFRNSDGSLNGCVRIQAT